MTHSVHGVLLAVDGVGILLTGPAGVGKSWLALELLDRRHRLIADDAPQLSINLDHGHGHGALYGRCPSLLKDLLWPRGLGVINVRRLFGAAAIGVQQRLELIIDLCSNPPAADPPESESLYYRSLLGIKLPCRTLILSRTPNPALWVECAARSYRLSTAHGYSAEQDLRQRLRHAMRIDSPPTDPGPPSPTSQPSDDLLCV